MTSSLSEPKSSTVARQRWRPARCRRSSRRAERPTRYRAAPSPSRGDASSHSTCAESHPGRASPSPFTSRQSTSNAQYPDDTRAVPPAHGTAACARAQAARHASPRSSRSATTSSNTIVQDSPSSPSASSASYSPDSPSADRDTTNPAPDLPQCGSPRDDEGDLAVAAADPDLAVEHEPAPVMDAGSWTHPDLSRMLHADGKVVTRRCGVELSLS